jgi:hypothetical protein
MQMSIQHDLIFGCRASPEEMEEHPPFKKYFVIFEKKRK